tara:strand:+ start:538 stop:702 length:165 start_codon:yes stop_codon:yes gene_type:complete
MKTSGLIREYMRHVDELARLWNETKDPEHKEKWYKMIKKIAILLEHYHPDDNKT